MATAYLGPRGSFSEEATRLYRLRDAGSTAVTVAGAVAEGYDDPGELLPFSSIPALVAAVETGLATDAILPIENSIEGAVSTTLDLLIHETTLKIRAEIVVPVRHDLIVMPGTTLADIRLVTSHPQALGQCRRFLDRCLPNVEQVAALSTSTAVSSVIADGNPAHAAIGTTRAAEIYGGEILARGIQDMRANVTRFVALAVHDSAPTGNDRTSIGFAAGDHNVPGLLYSTLEGFAEENLQLSKIESRPSKGWLGEYVFLLDFDGHRTEPAAQRAIDRVRDIVGEVMVFGSYPRFPTETLRELLEPSRRG